MADVSSDLVDAEKFFTEWWIGIPKHLAVPIFTLPDRKTVLCVGPGKAAEYAVGRAKADQDVYFGVGLQDPKRKAGRGKASDVEGLVGLWADVDYGAEGHKKPHAPTLEDAIALVDSMPASPTILVHSGHGLHAYWLFDEPLLFRNGQDDREAGAVLVAAWQETLRKKSKEKGWELDATHDLSRVLRVPGTVNRKGKPVQVQIVRSGGPRHRPEDLRKIPVDPHQGSNMGRSSPPNVESPKDALKNEPGPPVGGTNWPETDVPNPIGDIAIVAKVAAACLADRKFKAAWEKKRLDLESASEYDLSIASTLLGGGWSEKDVAEAILLWRTNHNENPDKARRGDYIYRTIRKAARGIESRKAVSLIKEEMASVHDGEKAKPEDKGKLIDRVRKALGIPIKRVIQHGREKSIYSIDLDDGQNIQLGENPAVTEVRLFQKATVDYTHEPIRIRQDDWSAGPGRALLHLSEMVENHESTRRNAITWLLREFLRSQSIYRDSSGEGFKEAVDAEQTFIRDEMVFFHGPKFSRHVAIKDTTKKWGNDLWEAVRVCGGKNSREPVPHGKTTKSYWGVPKEIVGDALVDSLESEVTDPSISGRA